MITRKKIISLTTLVVLLNIFVLSVSTAQDEDTTKSSLGYPFGTRLIIKGIRNSRIMSEGFFPEDGGNSILIDTINGIKLDKPINISVEDNGKTRRIRTKDFRHTYLGYEIGQWIGDDPGGQAAPQFWHSFVIDSVLCPQVPNTIKSDSTRNR